MTPQERAEFVSDIAQAIRSRSTDTTLNDDEVRALKLLIKRQEQSIALRQSIIDKSITSLVWSGIIGMGYILLGWATQHGYKP